ncbi:MAG: hypothetical protein LBJ63_07865 [Prevotellaceae bacterium]|jgi:hypothetical protein|nr:hypothetical protein [Prevotellaceae bacterium]
MEQSLFIKWINKYFKGIVVKTVEIINGKSNEQALTYLFRAMLRKEYSVTGKWEAISVLNTRISADYVAMDSSLPLKRRDSMGKASGDIAKSGMELWLNEKQLTDLDTMIAQRVGDADIIAKLFQDTPKVITGIYELLEKSFLEGLSTGFAVIDDTENVGTGVRLDYGYLDTNKFGVSQLWNNVSSTPLTDIRVALKKAKTDGNKIMHVYMDDVTFENFAKTQQVKDFYITANNIFASDATVPAPSLEKVNAALKADEQYRFQIAIIDRVVINEKNGIRTVVTPWSEGKVILTTTPQVGVLTWARLAEQNHPVQGVSYQIAEDFILVSKYRQNKPSLAEFTTSQARVVPVICNVEQIYQIDTKTVQA